MNRLWMHRSTRDSAAAGISFLPSRTMMEILKQWKTPTPQLPAGLASSLPR
jgi:hypothetical protein